MFDIFMNNQLVAIVIEPLVRPTINILVEAAGAEVNIISRHHIEAPEIEDAEDTKVKKTAKETK